MHDSKPRAIHRDPASAPTCRTAPLRIDSRDLFQGNRHIVIMHGGSEYRLQQTGRGKLILTK